MKTGLDLVRDLAAARKAYRYADTRYLTVSDMAKLRDRFLALQALARIARVSPN